jgi:hypothetical protein
MRTSLVPPLLTLLVAGTALAQNTIVSPTVATNSEGQSQNVFPWVSAVVRRYQQVHADLGPGAKAIRRLAFRLAEGTTNYTGTWTIDLEMFMGTNQGIAASSQFFDRNYLTPRSAVVARKTINWGPQGQQVSPGPCPFNQNTSVPLDAPHPYPGAPLALVWEAVVYANAYAGGGTFQDADVGTITTGTSALTGTGCIAIGRASAMTHGLSLTDVGGYLGMNATVSNGPASAPAVLALGSLDPNLPVPGLCSNLFTNLLIVIPIGMTDAAGAITTTTSGASTFFFRNTFGGATITTQVHSPDAGQPGIPLANSNGRSSTVPVPNLTRVCDVMRILNSAGGTTATQGIYFGTSSHGYGLVTQFTY